MKIVYAISSPRNTCDAAKKNVKFHKQIQMISVNNNNSHTTRTQWFYFRFCVDAVCFASKECCFLSIFGVFSRVFLYALLLAATFFVSLNEILCVCVCAACKGCLSLSVCVHDRDVQLIDWLLIVDFQVLWNFKIHKFCVCKSGRQFLFHLLFVNLRCIYQRGEADCRALPTKWLIVWIVRWSVNYSLLYKHSSLKKNETK